MAGSIYFEHAKDTQCRDKRHRSCSGRWRGEIREGATKSEVQDQINDIERELGVGVKASATYTVEQAVADWLDNQGTLSPKTIQTKRELLAPLLNEIGRVVLRDLEADDVLQALKASAQTRSNRTVRDPRAALAGAITYAQARGKVARNVAALVKAPPGMTDGRPSRALTLEQAHAVLMAARKDLLFAYLVVSLTTGVRTEEARALRWDMLTWTGTTGRRPTWTCSAPSGRTVTSRHAPPDAPWRCQRSPWLR
jgi:integrase